MLRKSLNEHFQLISITRSTVPGDDGDNQLTVAPGALDNANDIFLFNGSQVSLLLLEVFEKEESKIKYKVLLNTYF